MGHRPSAPVAGPVLIQETILKKLFIGVCMAAGLVACQKSPDQNPQTAPVAQTLLLGPEDVVTLGTSDAQTGPVITGSVQPERRADVRAEMAAVVLRVHKENGDAVKQGDLLVSLDDTVLRDNLSSADEAVRASAQSLDSAQRQHQRQKSLQAQGMVSMQALEEAEIRRNTAQSEWVAAKARAASARQQLDRTQVRAPFAGVVSARKVSAGDTVQMGKELVQIIDPQSLRLEGLVSAEHMRALQPGQSVRFHVNGLDNTPIGGKIRRIDAAVNPVTRQVAVLVDFTGPVPGLVAGLYAEGVIQTQSTTSLALPDGAWVRQNEQVRVWLLAADKIQSQAVTLGEREARTGLWPVQSGLKAGDRILRHPGSGLQDGQTFRFRTRPTGG